MSEDIFQEKINWAQIRSELGRNIAKSDAEFEREWEARVGAKATSQISQKWTSASGETSTAQRALDKLIKLGCERERILGRLYQYVGGVPEKVEAVKTGFQRQRDQLLSTAEAYSKAAKKGEQANALLSSLGIDAYNSPEEEMRSYGEFLTSIANTFVKDLASKKVSARDHHLDALVKMIEEVTGTPHYDEIATLVDRVGLAYDPEFTKVEGKEGEEIYEVTTADAIRGRIRRIREYGRPLFG